MGRPRKKKQTEGEESEAIVDQARRSAASRQEPSPPVADNPRAFAEAADWLPELRELYPEWEPPDPYDPEQMRESCDGWRESYIEIADEQDHQDFFLSDDLKKFLVLTEALARSAEANGLDSEPLIAFHRDAKFFYFKIQDRLPTAIDPVLVLLDRLKFKLDAQQQTSRPQATPSQAMPQPPSEPLLVLNQEHNERTNFPQIDETQFVMRWHGKPCEFTSGKPFEVLVYLVRRFNTWVSMQDIMDEVWSESRTHENTVQAAISKIRRIIKNAGITDLVIDGKTNPGHYKLHRT